MSGTLAGRRILITGAAKGIGRATVERFIKEGARVAALDRDSEALAALAGHHDADKLATFVVDVSDPASVGTAVTNATAALAGNSALDDVIMVRRITQ